LTEKIHPATLASEKQIHSLLVNKIIYTGFSNLIAWWCNEKKLQETTHIRSRTWIELKLVSGMTAKSRLQNLADVQRLIEKHHLTAGFAEHLNPYVRNKFIELLPW